MKGWKNDRSNHRLPSPPEDEDFQLVLLGIPSDANSSFLRGASEGPAALRRALHSGASNLWAENGFDVGASPRFVDGGDIGSPERQPAAADIRERVRSILASGNRVLAVGGDHAVTHPAVQAYAERFRRLRLVHFDAHPDLYEDYEGHRGSHACVFSRILEEGGIDRLVQMGIRTWNAAQRSQAERYGLPVRRFGEDVPDDALAGDGAAPVYLTVDLDVLDPAFAPGVSHHEPGGISTRTLLEWIHRIGGRLVGADVVELNPGRDCNGMTAAVAAKVVKEIAGRMLKNGD